ncbi:hypothetical protein BE21_21150 [Sorangium cellulosum]|uniref:Peptidoglycan binding-like domain-containing protein n=1 Tax=Sorangium cellulosum TaxID=56 RepID=A0A150TVZ3_SORCE|nr:hypothetical protein BE21_21150 [Sorangium cellulosum]
MRPGECASSIAARHHTTTEALWGHPENAALRARREDPNVLAPGDVLWVPEREPAAHPMKASQSHAFVAAHEPITLRLKLVEEVWEEGATVQGRIERHGDTVVYRKATPPRPPRDAPLANVPYRLDFGRRSIAGTTDGSGVLEARIPPHVEVGRLVLEPETARERAIELRVGHLDPLELAGGVKQRLANLGHPCGDVDDEDEALAFALESFQRKHGLSPSGQLDERTLDELRALSGR